MIYSVEATNTRFLKYHFNHVLTLFYSPRDEGLCKFLSRNSEVKLDVGVSSLLAENISQYLLQGID